MTITLVVAILALIGAAAVAVVVQHLWWVVSRKLRNIEQLINKQTDKQ